MTTNVIPEYNTIHTTYDTDENGLPLNLTKKQSANGIYMWTWLEPDGQWRAQCWVPIALRHLTGGRKNFTISKFPGDDERPAAFVAMKFKEDLENNLVAFTAGEYILPVVPTDWANTVEAARVTNTVILPDYVSTASHVHAAAQIPRAVVIEAIVTYYKQHMSKFHPDVRQARDTIAERILNVGYTDCNLMTAAVAEEMDHYRK